MAHEVELAAMVFGDLAALSGAPGTVLYKWKCGKEPLQKQQLIQGGIQV
jgi:hypothetical protein